MTDNEKLEGIINTGSCGVLETCKGCPLLEICPDQDSLIDTAKLMLERNELKEELAKLKEEMKK